MKRSVRTDAKKLKVFHMGFASVHLTRTGSRNSVAAEIQQDKYRDL